MAFPLPRGTTPSEIGFLAEMEMVTVVPRQRLEGLELLGVSLSHEKYKMKQELTLSRAQLNPWFLHDAPLCLSGSHCFSNVSAEQISCLQHGCTPNPSA